MCDRGYGNLVSEVVPEGFEGVSGGRLSVLETSGRSSYEV